MLVFRLVQRDGQPPYLTVSKPIYVPDDRAGATHVVDDMEGRLWLPTVVSTTLLEISKHQPLVDGTFPPSPPIGAGSPALAPEHPADVFSEDEATSGYDSNNSTESYKPSNGGSDHSEV
jgi:hypothetical protein